MITYLEAIPNTGRSLLVHARRFLRRWWKGLTKSPIDPEAKYVRSGPNGCADPKWLNDRKARPYLNNVNLGYFNHEPVGRVINDANYERTVACYRQMLNRQNIFTYENNRNEVNL